MQRLQAEEDKVMAIERETQQARLKEKQVRRGRVPIPFNCCCFTTQSNRGGK